MDTNTQAVLFGTLAAVCWGLSPFIGAPVARVTGSFHFTRMRTLMISGLMIAVALVLDRPLPSREALAYLIGSSVIGLAIGDVLMFYGLKILGPRRNTLLYSMSIPFSAGLAYGFLDERLSTLQLVGFFVAFSGVLVAIALRGANTRSEKSTLGPIALGVGAALAAAFCQACGSVLAKPAFTLGADPVWATAVRVTTAATLLNAIMLARMAPPRVKLGRPLLARTALSALIGPGLGILFFMIGLDTGLTMLVSLFSALSPLVQLPLLAFSRDDRPPALAWVGCLVTMVGTVLILWR